jgi:hypothetical protein
MHWASLLEKLLASVFVTTFLYTAVIWDHTANGRDMWLAKWYYAAHYVMTLLKILYIQMNIPYVSTMLLMLHKIVRDLSITETHT